MHRDLHQQELAHLAGRLGHWLQRFAGRELQAQSIPFVRLPVRFEEEAEPRISAMFDGQKVHNLVP